jgi:energy-coupling factor transport system ATP-binding protein
MSFWIVNDLNFAYPGRDLVIKDFSITISAGETVALTGPNGSGKTTLGKLLMGILKPGSGQILLEKKDITGYSLGEIGARVGYIFQNPGKQIFTPSVREEVAFGLKYRGFSENEVTLRVEEMLTYFELSHRADSFPFNLSRGEKQRLALAAILALEPGFVIFDEPTTGLDMCRKEKFARMLDKVRERGAGYILISHDLNFCAASCQRQIMMKEGKQYCPDCA